MALTIQKQKNIPDVLLLQHKTHGDHRGSLTEIYQQKEFQNSSIDLSFVQDNFVRSSQGTLRGLHYQIKNPQGKLLTVLNGQIFDVVVDLRKSSSTFGHHVSFFLTGDKLEQIWIPPEFAHGFYCLSGSADVLYKTTDFYSPKWDRTLLWNDPDLEINWPINAEIGIMLSEKDKRGTPLRAAETYP
ncbi:MAG: dTDP-4-dehydrorhamnose 3,5-epimerase [Anaerolineales bacterium]|nr:dTDP-4-dehydrorhamnose 3,5-epimerase [Chloroflexota bacterium]MBL6980982.1 dTDP-4-dehydrorhamnose 3,5-epimerase [Anaerolineales bacterium]